MTGEQMYVPQSDEMKLWTLTIGGTFTIVRAGTANEACTVAGATAQKEKETLRLIPIEGPPEIVAEHF